MGEVYRARDTKLNRDVALKLLPEDLASDRDRLARLRREAQVLASLNHPHIAAIYGLEEADGKLALVLELVEGEALDERLARGPISVEEALPMARQIAEGLEAAHDKGIVHRDLKPSNVKLTKNGDVKILDFGLAKALGGEVTNEGDPSQSPTLSHRMTEAGVILGTAGYMSPEQARGKPVDRRADIWAFGVVLFEMLSGRRLFSGETVSDTIAAVLRQEIDWKALPASTPNSVRWLLERCLNRDPKQRLQAIGEARIAIDAREARGAVPIARATPLWGRALPWVMAGLGFAMTLWLSVRWPSPSGSTPARLSVELGADVSLAADRGSAAILSPHGSILTFVATKDTGGQRQLYVRRLDELAASPLPGTEGAQSPFFSPDGQWIAFFADGKLKKISVTGGAAVSLCDATWVAGGAWADDGTIVFSFSSGGDRRVSLHRVSPSGGTPEPLTTLEGDERTQIWPQVLPGSRAVLYTGHSRLYGFDGASLVVQPLPKGARKVVLRGGYHGRYVGSGHLVYMHEGTLFAAPFDLGRLELTGSPVPALEGVTANPLDGATQYGLSGDGTLVYLPGQSAELNAIQWMDRQGKTTPLWPAPAGLGNIFLSPDASGWSRTSSTASSTTCGFTNGHRTRPCG
jgi:serine/threonine-protein kinase